MTQHHRPHSHRSARALALAALAALAGGAHAQVATTPANTYSYSRTSSFTYYPNGLLESETVEPGIPDLAVVTTYTYNGYGNKTSVSTANVAEASAAARFDTRTASADYGAHVVTIGSVSVAVPAGAFATTATNALGHSETRTYDPRFGTALRLTGPNGLVTAYEYDDFGRATKETRADGTYSATFYCIVSGRGLSTSSNSSACGASTTALSGNAAEIPEDAVSYVQTQAFTAAKLPNGPATRVYKDRAGRTVREIGESFDGDGQPTNRRYVAKDTGYDVYGVAVMVTQPYFFGAGASTVGGGSNTVGLTRTRVDALGRVIQVDVSDPDGNADGTDIAGRTIRVARTQVQYEGLATTTTNPKGQTRKEEKNADGRVVRFTDAYGAELLHQHDAFGNLVLTKDALGNVVRVGYDIRGRKIQMVDPDTGTWTYAYDALGQLKEQRSPTQAAAGTRTAMVYDKLGRMTQRVEPEYTSNWYYDKRFDGTLCMEAVSGYTGAGKGRLCETRTSHGVTKTYAYDNKGRPTAARTDISSGPSFGSALAYDPATGRLASQIYPSGLMTVYGYTPSGFLSELRLSTAVTVGGTKLGSNALLWRAGAVNAWGKPEGQTLGAGTAAVTSRAVYDPASGRLEALRAGTGGGTEVLSQDYTWDSLGRLTARSDANGDGNTGAVSETFVYDRLNRLTQYGVAAPMVPGDERLVQMHYNALGNLLYKSDVGNYEYAGAGSARPHAVRQIVGSSFGTVSYGYDASGNATSADGQKWRSIAYTSFNLPDSNTGLGGAGGYPRYTWQYDEAHQRIKETRVTGGATRTTWYQHPDNQGGLAFETESVGGSTSHRHYLSAGTHTVVIVTGGALPAPAGTGLAPGPLATVTATKLEVWHKDHLGSLITTTDHTGKVTARYAYDPYGKRRYTSGQYDAFGTLVVDWAGSGAGTDRGFTGHEHLDDVGVVHMNGRIFDPVIGRFLQGDPMIQAPGELQNYDRYGYCLSAPLGCTDPSGYSWLSRAWKKLWHNEVFRAVASIAVAVYAPGLLQSYAELATGSLANAAAAGFLSGAVSSGSLQVALQGSFSASVFFGVGEIVGNAGLTPKGTIDSVEKFAGSVALHGVAGCVTSAASGGKCGSGAISAAFSKAALPISAGLGDGLERGIAHAIIGGTASVLGGGKFANGATTGAFSYLFNQLQHPSFDPGAYLAEKYQEALQAWGKALDQVYGTWGDVSLMVLGGPIGAEASAGRTIYVIGRQGDTAIAAAWEGHEVLATSGWTLAKQDAWTASIIEQRGTVYLASPLTKDNLWNYARNEISVFAREVKQFIGAGYRKVGDYLVPPPK